MEDVGDIVLFQITDRLLLGEGAPPVDDDEVIGIVFQLFDGEGGVIIDAAQIDGFGDFAREMNGFSIIEIFVPTFLISPFEDDIEVHLLTQHIEKIDLVGRGMVE